jgi:hypothetical protein
MGFGKAGGSWGSKLPLRVSVRGSQRYILPTLMRTGKSRGLRSKLIGTVALGRCHARTSALKVTGSRVSFSGERAKFTRASHLYLRLFYLFQQRRGIG